MSERVKAGDQVSIHYSGKFEDGTVFDSSEGREALQFEAGSESVITGVSEAVIGMEVGEAKTVEVPPDQGYGPRQEEMMVRVKAEQLPDGVQQGDVLSDGKPGSRNWIVVEKNEEGAVLDGNHPLAGKTLFFDLTLVAIQ